jgi:NADPH-dependent ferric siderophore reductase
MNVMRAAIRPKPITPPTAPPIIAGVLLTLPASLPLLLLLAAADDEDRVGIGVLEAGRREDSMCFVP